MRATGRALLLIAALLLVVTAALHAAGCGMVAEWTGDLGELRSNGLQLVWLTDSLSWVVAATIFLLAALRPAGTWPKAALIVAAIPFLTGAAIVALAPGFFGGWMLLGSAAFSMAGALFLIRLTLPK